jgi:hypothetical protein
MIQVAIWSDGIMIKASVILFWIPCGWLHLPTGGASGESTWIPWEATQDYRCLIGRERTGMELPNFDWV